MNCHLIEQSKAGQMTPDAIKSGVEWTESVLESDPFDVAIVKCRTCGQTFAYCFKQFTWGDGDDDYWTFWIPIEEKEIESVRVGGSLFKLMAEMTQDRPHICWSPEGRVFWAEKGFPLAFIVFLP